MQFDRFIEIIVRNFDTKEEFSVSSKDGFRIDFDYNEYLDQSSSSNTGTVKIYNLSIQTFQKIGQRFRTEIEIWCGYKNQTTNTVDRLCIGGLTSKSRVREGADYITTMEFQTAIRELNTSNKISKSFPPNTRLYEIIESTCAAAGFTRTTFLVTKEDVERFGKEVIDRVETVKFAYGIAFHGTPKQVFTQISDMFAIGYTIDSTNPKHIVWYIQEQGYHKLETIKDSMQTGGERSNTIPTDNSSSAQVLRMETGLVGSPYVETIETNTGYFEALDETNEELIYAKPIEVKRNSKGEVMKDKDGNVKYTKPQKDKKIARVIVNAKALINPAIKPNSWIKLENTYNQVDGFYRVRNIKYTGSTHENDAFIMEMTLTLMK